MIQHQMRTCYISWGTATNSQGHGVQWVDLSPHTARILGSTSFEKTWHSYRMWTNWALWGGRWLQHVRPRWVHHLCQHWTRNGQIAWLEIQCIWQLPLLYSSWGSYALQSLTRTLKISAADVWVRDHWLCKKIYFSDLGNSTFHQPAWCSFTKFSMPTVAGSVNSRLHNAIRFSFKHCFHISNLYGW